MLMLLFQLLNAVLQILSVMMAPVYMNSIDVMALHNVLTAVMKSTVHVRSLFTIHIQSTLICCVPNMQNISMLIHKDQHTCRCLLATMAQYYSIKF